MKIIECGYHLGCTFPHFVFKKISQFPIVFSCPLVFFNVSKRFRNVHDIPSMCLNQCLFQELCDVAKVVIMCVKIWPKVVIIHRKIQPNLATNQIQRYESLIILLYLWLLTQNKYENLVILMQIFSSLVRVSSLQGQNSWG